NRIAVRTKLVTAIKPRAKQYSGAVRTSIDEERTSRPLASVSATAATIQTNSSETITAVRVISDSAVVNVPGPSGISSDGAATDAVTAVAARIALTRKPLRIYPPRSATQQQHENRVEDQKQRGKDERAERAQFLIDHIDDRPRAVGANTGGERLNDRNPRRGAERERDGQHHHRATGHQRPGAIAGLLPWRQRKGFDGDRTMDHRRAQDVIDLAAAFADGEVAGVRFRILCVSLAGVVGHSGSTNVSSSVLSRFRARNSLFFTVPSGSFFMVAISS